MPQPAMGQPAMPSNAVMPTELRLHSHSSIFYWWPVWFFGLLFSLLTYFNGSHLAIVPSGSTITEVNEAEIGKPSTRINVPGKPENLWDDSVDSADKSARTPKIRISNKEWMGPFFTMILLMVIFITNVPLRGTLSIIAIMTVMVVVLLISLAGWWGAIMDKLVFLRIYQNMGGYLTLSLVLLAGWCMAIFVVDRRTFIVFTKGSIRVREEIGGKEKTYDTTGMSITKLRDDWFRHVVLGLGTGDLVVQTFGAEKHEIRMPNIWKIDSYLPIIENMMKK